MNLEERALFVAELADAIHGARPVLSDEELRWVKLAIEKEGLSIRLRRAIIEKTLAGLVWAGLAGLLYMFVGWATTHGYKP